MNNNKIHGDDFEIPAICKLTFDQLHTTLDKLGKQMETNHAESKLAIADLAARVMNGLSHRINGFDKELALMRKERELEDELQRKHARRMSHWESATISCVVVAAFAGLWFLVTQIVERQGDKTRTTVIEQLQPLRAPAAVKTNRATRGFP